MQTPKGIIFITLLLILSIHSQTTAQILPPDLICVKNDTLVWELPNNNCGPFISYLIYASEEPGGPYSVLTTISDPNQDFFFHEAAGGDLWYYYLESNYDCPGENPFPSDTLDNRIPLGGPIDFVTVDGDAVEINWTPSPSPEVFAYVISRNTPTGTTIIDTVYNGTTYVDPTASPDTQPETYFVVALDPCGNKSLVGDPHNTLFLEITGVDACEQAIDLAWNPYQNWLGGIARQEILLSTEGGPYEVIDDIDGDALSYRFDQANDGEEYCFVVRAVRGDDESVTSSSSVICTSVDITQPVRELTVANATYTPDGSTVEVFWRWNDNAELDQAALLRSLGSGNFGVVHNPGVAPPLQLDNTYLDDIPDPAAGAYFYRVETTDDCDDGFSSNTVATVFARAAPLPDQTNQVEWTELVNENAANVTYELFRVTGTGTEPLGTFAPGQTQYIDLINVDDPGQTAVCYYVEAAFEVVFPDGSTERLRSRSNTACAEQVADLYVPNAFAPEGVNRIFVPILPFGAPQEYSLVIYDRWGGKVFESANIDTGWDGTKKGQDLPQGAYLYYINWTTSEGQERRRVGTVNLIR